MKLHAAPKVRNWNVRASPVRARVRRQGPCGASRGVRRRLRWTGLEGAEKRGVRGSGGRGGGEGAGWDWVDEEVGGGGLDDGVVCERGFAATMRGLALRDLEVTRRGGAV